MSPQGLNCASPEDTQTLSGKSDSVSCVVPGTCCDKIWFDPSLCLWCIWCLIPNAISTHLLSCWAAPLLLDVGFHFLVGSNILLLIVVHQLDEILYFSREEMDSRPSILLSEALHSQQKQGWEQTVAKSMNSLLQSSDLN